MTRLEVAATGIADMFVHVNVSRAEWVHTKAYLPFDVQPRPAPLRREARRVSASELAALIRAAGAELLADRVAMKG